MGMGAAPGMVIPIKEEVVKTVVGESYQNLKKILEKAEITLDELARGVTMDEIGFCILSFEITEEDLENALESVLELFKKKTGLSLSLTYIDPEDADRYDDITGPVFDVSFSDVFEKTPKAKKFEDDFGESLEIALFTQFG